MTTCTATTAFVTTGDGMATQEELADMLRDALSRGRRSPVEIVKLTRKGCPFATLCPVEQVVVELADGQTRSLFVKYLGHPQPDHPDKRRRDREALAYDRLFGAPGLPVPLCFGTGRAQAGREVLVLEYVDDWNLKYHDLNLWYLAALRLADLHAHFALRAAELKGYGFLLQLDETYLLAWATRAVDVVAAAGPAEFAARLAALVCDRYPKAAGLLARQPATLVHNDLAPKNVIADRRTSPATISIVDWEMCGAGCGLLDLVHLKYGLPPDADAAMVDAYRGGLAESGLLPPDDGVFAALLAACELHKTLYRLAHSTGWGLPTERIAQWIEDALALMQRVEGGGA